MIFTVQLAHGQSSELDMELEVSDQDKILLFGGFAIAIVAIFLFLARDIILRKKTSYDKENMESKKDKTFEKYHSEWGDDYEEIGQRTSTKEDKEFRDASINDELPNYYEVLEVDIDASSEEIKKKFRELAKKIHPDKTKEDSEKEMAELNKAYEILSDEENRKRYDRFFKTD
ncbi:MAG: DnaJ domain-containing protein [Nitrosopumilus sp. (ex Thoosa mismalolli)]|nr:DnaJ domain-containing protein [Nitrosopumilus sp. (ex Thoosa mismalolli)]